MTFEVTIRPVTLADHLEAETAGWKTPAQSPEAEEIRALNDMMSDSGIHRFIEVRDNGRFAQAMRLTTSMLKDMPQIEWRLLKSWIDSKVRELSGKSALLSRHLSDEPEIPASIRA